MREIQLEKPKRATHVSTPPTRRMRKGEKARDEGEKLESSSTAAEEEEEEELEEEEDENGVEAGPQN